MDKQKVFDRVVTHLRTQNAQSLGNYGCAYRGEDGAKCAAGCLIREEDYSKNLEGKAVWARSVYEALDPDLQLSRDNCNYNTGTYQNDDATFLRQLQTIHDEFTVEQWERCFSIFAQEHGLTLSPRNEVL